MLLIPWTKANPPPPYTPVDPTHPLARDLICCYPLNEEMAAPTVDAATLPKVFDASINHRHMSSNGTGAGTIRQRGGWLFDGSVDYFRTAIDLSINNLIGTGPFTMFAEASLGAGAPNNTPVFMIDRWSPGAGLYVKNTTTWGGWIVNVAEAAGSALTQDVVYSLVMVRRNTGTDGVEFYKNGSPDGTQTNSGNVTATYTDRIWIGSNSGSNMGYGLVKFCAAWSRDLTQAEIIQLHLNPYQMFQPMAIPFSVAAGAPVGAIINQLQQSNIGADLYNGTLQ